MQATAALAAFFLVLDAGGWSFGQDLPRDAPLYLEATTACLAAIVLAQMVNVLVCRDPKIPFWRIPLRGNPLLLVAVLIEFCLLLLIVYTPVGQRIFGTAELHGSIWAYMIAFALGFGLLEELRKALVRVLARRASLR